jgi:hypothetical protein
MSTERRSLRREQKGRGRGLLIATLGLAAAALVGASAQAQPPRQQQQQQQQQQQPDHAIEAYVSENALQALYIRDLDLNEVGAVEVRGGVFFNEARDLIAVAGALSEIGGPEGLPRLDLRIGPRMYGAFLNGEDQDIFGMGVGGEARYFLDAGRTTSVSLAAYYVPDILTFGDADNISDTSLRLETRLQRGMTIFVGYRVFEIDMPEDREVDDNVHIGFRLDF